MDLSLEGFSQLCPGVRPRMQALGTTDSADFSVFIICFIPVAAKTAEPRISLSCPLPHSAPARNH